MPTAYLAGRDDSAGIIFASAITLTRCTANIASCITSEHGGIPHTFHILVAKSAKNGTKPQVVWSAVEGPFKDCAAFLDALRSGKLDDGLDYAR